ncbi:MAG: glutamine-hydrolyzing carbamoyl-phosphate synthase small subunit [Actinomycetales bacterium]
MTGREPGVLVLEDARVFRGRAYGAVGATLGEAVFATGMTGYQETLTDPSYHRQIVVMTAPHIGNTGVNAEDRESARIWVAGYVVRDPARRWSSHRGEGSLDDDLRDQGVVGLAGVDTRAVVRHVRERGAMRAGVFSGAAARRPDGDLLAEVLASPPMSGADLVGEVTTDRPYVVPAVAERRFTVAVVDLGVKATTLRRMAEHGIEVHVLPAGSTVAQVTAVPSARGARHPDGVFFSNGPGDPGATEAPMLVLREVLRESVPFFGICLGNQLLGRALGFGTFKLPFGHRGLNQPVLDRATGTVEITAQNHGFAVDAPVGEPVEAPAGGLGRVEVSHVGLNDGVVEGLRLLDRPGFSVQYHPEAAAGPHDADHLFARFTRLMADAGPTGEEA